MHSAEWNDIFADLRAEELKKQVTDGLLYGIMTVHRKIVAPFADSTANSN